MSTKKILKYVFIGIVGLLIGKIVVQKLFDSRPFKFEEYKSSKQLEVAAKLRFPVGGEIDKIISVLEKSGAGCFVPKCYGECKNYEVFVDCEYYTGLFSLRPFESYRIKLYINKDHKLIELNAWRLPGIIYGT